MGRRNQQVLRTLARQEEKVKKALNDILKNDEKIASGNVYEAIASEARKIDSSISAGFIETQVMPKHHAALASMKQDKTDAELKAAGFSDHIIENARHQHERDAIDAEFNLQSELDHTTRAKKREEIRTSIAFNVNHDGSLKSDAFSNDNHKDALHLPGEEDGIKAGDRVAAVMRARKPELRNIFESKKSDYQNILTKEDKEIKIAINDLYGASGTIASGKVTEDAIQAKLSVIIKKFRDKNFGSGQTVALTDVQKYDLITAFGKSDDVNAAIEQIFKKLYDGVTTPDWVTHSQGKYKDVVKLTADEVFSLKNIMDESLKKALKSVINSGALSIPTTPDEAQYENRIALKMTEVDVNKLAQVLKAITEDNGPVDQIEKLIKDYRLIEVKQAVEHYLPHVSGSDAIADALKKLVSYDRALDGYSIKARPFDNPLEDAETDAIHALISGDRSIFDIAQVFGLIITDVVLRGESLPKATEYVTFLRQGLIERALSKYTITDSEIQNLVKALVKTDGTVRNLEKEDITTKVKSAMKTMLSTKTVDDIATMIEDALRYVYPKSLVTTKDIILTAVLENILEEKGVATEKITSLVEIIKTHFVNKDLSDPTLILAQLTIPEKTVLNDAFGMSADVNNAIEQIFEEIYKAGAKPDWVKNSKRKYKGIVKLTADEVFVQYKINNDNKLKDALKPLIDTSGALKIPKPPVEDQYENRKVLKNTEVHINTLAKVLSAITESPQSVSDIEESIEDYRSITAEQAAEHRYPGSAANTGIASAVGKLINFGASLQDISSVTLEDSEVHAIQQLTTKTRSIAGTVHVFGSIIADVAKKGEAMPETGVCVAFLKKELIEKALKKYAITDSNIQNLVELLVQDDGTVRDLEKEDLTEHIKNAMVAMLSTKTVVEIAAMIEGALMYVDPKSRVVTNDIILTAVLENILVKQGIAAEEITSLVGIIKANFIDENGKVIDPSSIKLANADGTKPANVETQKHLQKISKGMVAGVKASDFDAILESIDPEAKVGGIRAYDPKSYKEFFKTIVPSEADLKNGIVTPEQFCIPSIVNLPQYKIDNIANINRSIMWQKPIIQSLALLVATLGILDGETRVVTQVQITDFVKSVQTALNNFPVKILCMDGEEKICNGLKLKKEMEPFCLDVTVIAQTCNHLKGYAITSTRRKIKDFTKDMTMLVGLLNNATKLEMEKISTIIDCKISSNPITWNLDHNALNHVHGVLNDNEQVCPDVVGASRELCPKDIAGLIDGFSVFYNETFI